MKYNRFLVLLTPLIALLLCEVLFFMPKMFYVILVFYFLIIFFAVNQFTKSSKIDKRWYNFIIFPLCFSISLIIYSIISVNKFFVQILFFTNAFFIYYYLRNIYYYLIRPDFYKDNTLENISSYGNFLLIFFIASSIYGLQSFLNLSVCISIIIILPFFALVIHQVIWINKIDFKIGFIYILIGCLILIEIAWALSFLPVNYKANGLVMAICYYILIGIIRFYLKGSLNKRIVKLYLFFGFSSIFITLLTARWM